MFSRSGFYRNSLQNSTKCSVDGMWWCAWHYLRVLDVVIHSCSNIVYILSTLLETPISPLIHEKNPMSDTSFFFLILVSWYIWSRWSHPTEIYYEYDSCQQICSNLYLRKATNVLSETGGWFVQCCCFFLLFFNLLTSLKCQLQTNSVINITHTKNYWVVFFICAKSLDICFML